MAFEIKGMLKEPFWGGKNDLKTMDVAIYIVLLFVQAYLDLVT